MQVITSEKIPIKMWLNDIEQGIVHGMRNKSDLDEATGAYKPIEQVMVNQADLVKILIQLTPMAVIKG